MKKNAVHPLKAVRCKNGLTQDELADEMKISKQWISRIENFKPVGRAAAIKAAVITGLKPEAFIFPDVHLRQYRAQ